MALVIKWTLQANKRLERVLKYLEKEWTVREILQLENKIKLVYLQKTHNRVYNEFSKHKICFI